jgi:ribosomal protein L11 methyltransferase
MFVWSKLSSIKWSDAWEERFCGAPHLACVLTQIPGRNTIRVEVFCKKHEDALIIQKVFGGGVRKVVQQNWAAMAPAAQEPLKIRDCMVVTPLAKERELKALKKEFPGRHIVSIPAELAFGTGHHETTSTVLRFLVDTASRWAKEGREWTLCDLGCGTGILGIAGRMLGAKKVWGCDFDPQAVKVSKDNVTRNGLDKTVFAKADVLKWQPKVQWDCVCANIFHDVLIEAFPTIVKAVKPGGIVMVSGILKTQAEECLSAGRASGIIFEKVVTKGKWTTAWGRPAGQ